MNGLHRFFLLDSDLQPGRAVDLQSIAHQLQIVLRLQPGTQITLLDGQGHAYLAEITQLDRKVSRAQIMVQLPAPPEPGVPVTLYQCSLKADKFEWVLQKGTELGVARFVPVISQRSIVRPAAALLKKYERWQAIVREAAEQSGRGRIPDLAPPLEWQAALLDAQPVRLLAWEEQHPLSAPVKTALSSLHTTTDSPAAGVSLFIGPEGGIAPDEAAAALAAGWQAISLGPRILRAETAALAGIVLVMDQLTQ